MKTRNQDMSKASVEKAVRLLEMIRANTDEKHPATQDSLRKLPGGADAKEIMGDKGTYSRRLNEIADAFNKDSDGNLKPKDEWKIVYPGYGRDKSDGKRNGKVFYRHPVSEEELAFLVSSIRQTHNLTQKEKDSLEQRIREALGSRFYPEPDAFAGCLIRDLDAENGENISRIENNIGRIRKYIRERLMADITVSGLPGESDLRARKKYQVSPYRIVKKDSCYYLIANWHERPEETYVPDPGAEPYLLHERRFPWYSDELTAFRIDLIEEIADAHVPDTIRVHWTMNPLNLRPRPPYDPYAEYYTRGSLRKARYRQDMRDRLELFDSIAPDLHFEHCRDIEMKNNK